MCQSLELFNGPPKPIQIQLWMTFTFKWSLDSDSSSKYAIYEPSNEDVENDILIECLKDKLCDDFVCNKYVLGMGRCNQFQKF